jgi:putative salt-induced outer membrane protein YdiY
MTRCDRMLALTLVCAVCALATFAPGARAQDDAPTAVDLADPAVVGTLVTLQLEGGDQLSGRLLRVEEGVVVIRHSYLGEVSVPEERVLVVVHPFTPAGEPLVPVHPEAIVEPAPEEDADTLPSPVAPEPVEDEPGVTWERQFEVGLRGSEGNTERLNFDAGLRLRRDGPATIFTWNTLYQYATQDGNEIANRLESNLRNEWKLENPRWTVFAQGSFLFDEFQDFDYRVAAGGGVGYLLIDEEDTSLNVRVGAGVSREFGDEADTRLVPEGIIGAEFRHAFSDNQRFIATAELFPDLDDTGEFRSISTAGYEIDIDQANGLSLRLGAEHRHDSTPGDAEANDFDYFARLVYSF